MMSGTRVHTILNYDSNMDLYISIRGRAPTEVLANLVTDAHGGKLPRAFRRSPGDFAETLMEGVGVFRKCALEWVLELNRLEETQCTDMENFELNLGQQILNLIRSKFDLAGGAEALALLMDAAEQTWPPEAFNLLQTQLGVAPEESACPLYIRGAGLGAMLPARPRVHFDGWPCGVG